MSAHVSLPWVAVGAGEGDGVELGVGVAVGAGEGDGVGAGVREGVGVGVGDGVGAGDGLDEGAGVGLGVGLAVGAGEGLGVGAGDGAGVGDGVIGQFAQVQGDGMGAGSSVLPKLRDWLQSLMARSMDCIRRGTTWRTVGSRTSPRRSVTNCAVARILRKS